MRIFYALPVLAILAVQTPSPMAQVSNLPTTSTFVPAFHADLNGPASSSSSSTEALFEAHGQASTTPTPAKTLEGSSGGPFSGLGVGFKIGLGGIGVDVATPLIPQRLNLRGGAGFFSYSHTFTASSDNIVGTLKLNNAEAMADFFPFHGSFRLSAGLTVYNTTALNGILTFPAGSNFTVGNSKYTSAPAPNSANGTAAFKFGSNTVPRFTFGWGNMVPKTGHIKFETEIGIEYIGNPTVAWNITGQACTTTSGSAGVPCSSEGYGPVAAADIAQEQTNLQNDLNGLKVFPVVSFGLSYKIH
jgi:hypothetical protein